MFPDGAVKPRPFHFERVLRLAGVPLDGPFGNGDRSEFFTVFIYLENDVGFSYFPPGKVDMNIVLWHAEMGLGDGTTM
jgi:hypothetical protein